MTTLPKSRFRSCSYGCANNFVDSLSPENATPAREIPLDIHKYINAKPAMDIVLNVLSIIRCSLGGQYRANARVYKATLETVLANLFIAWDRHPETKVTFHAKHSCYKVGSRYNKLGIGKVTLKIINALEVHGLIARWVGFFDRDRGTGKISRMRTTDKLADMFEVAALSREYVERAIEEIVLRDKPSRTSKGKRKKGADIEYEDDGTTEGMRKTMRRINAMLGAGSIRLKLTSDEMDGLRKRMGREIDFTCRKLQRIFNETFERGGRTYGGWWQGIPSEFRPKIEINGNPTAELDYKELHPRLAYASIGVLPPEGDLYSIPMMAGRDDTATWRKLCKLSLNFLLNAQDKKIAVHAVQDKCIELGIKTSHVEIRWAMMGLEEKHKPIQGLFYTGAGAEFQYTDSEMAIEIMIALQEKGILALPIHDSFVVEVQHVQVLEEAMVRAFESRCGYLPPIERKF